MTPSTQAKKMPSRTLQTLRRPADNIKEYRREQYKFDEEGNQGRG